MRHIFAPVLLVAFSLYSSGQTPSPSPTPDQQRVRDFGWSLKKYEDSGKKRKSNSKDPPSNSSDSDNGVIKVKTDLVVSDILVTDQKANVITTLKKDDFVVTEDGSPQTIEMFSLGENAGIPRSIVLILDRGDVAAPYIKNSITAARILVDKLGPNDKMSIVTTDLQLRLDFTRDKLLLKKTLDSLERTDPPHGSGGEFSTLLAVLNEMFPDDNRKQ